MLVAESEGPLLVKSSKIAPHAHYRLDIRMKRFFAKHLALGKSDHPLKGRVGLQDVTLQIQQLDPERCRFKD